MLLVVVMAVPTLAVVEVVVGLYGHFAQPLQYQFPQATFQPPCMLLHTISKHCCVVVVDVVAFGPPLVVFVVVEVVTCGHCGHDAQNH